jgi:DNA replication and repair protein RecF
MLAGDSTWWRIDLDFDDGARRSVKFDPNLTSGRKKFVVDDKTSYRLAPKYKLPVVLFEPDDLRLLNGSPTRRRQFIDRFISQLDPLYAASTRKYDRALKQRNNLLKRPYLDDSELFVWNVALAQHGAYIIEQRTVFIERINSQLNQSYNDIAHSSDSISVHYSHTSIGDVQQKLLSELDGHCQKDRASGNTSVGPHRHDVIFNFNSTPALSTASRGEVRTIVLALKFLEVGIIEQITGVQPIILLDDVFSELDIARQQALSDTIRSHQIIITSTHVLSDKASTYQHIKLSAKV